MVSLHSLDRKLLRDLWRLRSQALAIALVLGCGVAIFLTGFGMLRALEATQRDYYARQGFADVFASASRAPLSLLDDVREIDGVRAVQARVTGWVILDLPGRAAPASGRVLSLPAGGAGLNAPLLVTGRLPDPDSEDEVAVTDRFAKANGFGPGSRFAAITDGTRITMTITGTLRSPEFIYALPPGGLMPDDAGFGVIWMPERAAAATFDMTGAFNDLALALRRDARPQAVIDQLDRLLDPWGGTGAHDRADQVSHAFLQTELDGLRGMTLVLPPVFFAIAGFLVNMVMGNIVALERSEIGLLKALGYRNREIGLHYLMMAALVGTLGIVIGWVAGAWLTEGMARLYAKFYDFPWLVRMEGWDQYAFSGLIGLAAAGIGAMRSVLAAVRLAPAVAMAPPVPPSFRHGPVDRLASWARLSQSEMMILRGLMRWPVRALSTSFGLAFGVAVLVASGFFQGSMDKVIDSAFFKANRQHATLVLASEATLDVVHDVRALPGVLRVEPQFDLPVTLRNGARSKQVAISAHPPGGDLVRVLDTDDRVIPVPAEGIVLSQRLAMHLGVGPGDLVQVDVTRTRRTSFSLSVAGIATQYIGLGAYMQLDALSARLLAAPRITALNVALDTDQLLAFQARLKQLPAVASVVMMTEVRDSFRQTLGENLRINMIVFLTIAVLITIGVAYNNARIQLSERARELASLRILGFTRPEISMILLGETAVLALLAQPLGWAIGAGLAWLMVIGFDTDLFRVPLVLTPAGFATASLVSLAATGAAALLVRQRLDRLDLVSVLKTRE
ncbi:ABC transporter permease [Tropicibacter oceani]|uniref:FtsX-like permease family protein n=1 Tax=Tropicibacter oceani TaxID=3058420 RepID=A0ABY8QH71_9RHOB|nr:ABC transporter permease [Tropicibacter oceani]WGW03323.1 FtsX-like permease family protein [Tropicibacter oceani]